MRNGQDFDELDSSSSSSSPASSDDVAHQSGRKMANPLVNDGGPPSATPSKCKQRPAVGQKRPRIAKKANKSRTIVCSSLVVLALSTGRLVQTGSRELDRTRIKDHLLILPAFSSSSSSSSASTAGAVNENAKTLALLYPPGLLGGYRNQVMRFIALVTYANTHNMSQILLNSLLWSTQLNGIGSQHAWFPVPFEMLFDVEYWNTFAPEHLPLLVRDDQITKEGESDEKAVGKCWSRAFEIPGYKQLSDGEAIGAIQNHQQQFSFTYNGQNTTINHLQRAALLQGTLTPLMNNVTVPFITGQLSGFNPRKQNLLPATEHCRLPFVYGGGTHAGVLWNDYLHFHQSVKADQPQHRNTSAVPFDTDVWVYRALQPAPQWRALAEQCVGKRRYIALHARVELEIMRHNCGSRMEKNLTAIVERVYNLYGGLSSSNEEQHGGGEQPISGLFIAASRAGMEEKGTGTYEKFKQYADENLRTLNLLTAHDSGLGAPTNDTDQPQLFSDIQNKLPVFECGEPILKDYYSKHLGVLDYGALLQSILNFHVAVSADVFVGVKDSSYSTDVLTTRYWLGKGDANYRYTKTGIERVQGLPEPHKTCKK